MVDTSVVMQMREYTKRCADLGRTVKTKRKFICETCRKKFTNEAGRRAHRLMKHGE